MANKEADGKILPSPICIKDVNGTLLFMCRDGSTTYIWFYIDI